MKKPISGIISTIYIVACLCILPAWSASVTSQGAVIIFENMHIRYEVGQNGFSKRLLEKSTGREYLDQSMLQPFMYIRKGGEEHAPSKVSLETGVLKVDFGSAEVTSFIKVEARGDCFIFDLVRVEGRDIEVFGLARLQVAIQEHIGNTLNVAFDDKFGVCLLGLNLQTHAEGESREKAILGVSCIPRFGITGSRFALMGAPKSEILPIIGKLEVEFGLPHPIIDGEWDKISRGVRTSYLLIDGSQTNIDECIKYARQGGFSYIMLLGGCFSSYGHYAINTKMFPDGIEGFKATMKKIHAAGLKGGIHFLVGWVSKTDPYVAPIPDKRLATEEEFTLSQEITADADFIPTAESPEGMPVEPEPIRKGGCDLRIGDELIYYTELSTAPPYGFKGCKRGINGTQASSHAKGTVIYHMVETWRHYVVGADTDMLQEMASRMGKIFNECEVDMIDFDGGETMASLGSGWYYIGKVKEAYYKSFNREVLYGGSGTTTYAWHIYSRGSGDDYAVLAVKKFLDRHKAPNRMRVYHDNLLPAEFGWWGYLAHSPSVEASLPDEIEYGYSKGAGYDTPMGLETHIRDLAGNGRTDEILAMARRWEELRLDGKLSDNIKAELRTLGQEHTLLQDGSGNWKIHRISYGPEYYAKSPEAAWRYFNKYSDQTLRVRIKAMCRHAEYGDSRNIQLTRDEAVGGFNARTASPEIAIQLSVSTENVKTGNQSWKITGTNTGNETSSWAELEYRYAKPLNLLKNRGLGVWVWGDGRGALLNLSIVESGGVMRRDHYVDLNFNGWRYFELSEPEADRVYEYKWPYSIKWPTYHIDYEDIGRIDIFLNKIPAHCSVTCYLSPFMTYMKG